MTPQEWNAALPAQVRWQVAYPIVEREARAFLNWIRSDDPPPMSTSELVEQLYPKRLADQTDAGKFARATIFKALLADKNPWRAEYAVQGPMRLNGINKGSRPWLWGPRRLPATKADPKCSTCPTCGQEVF